MKFPDGLSAAIDPFIRVLFVESTVTRPPSPWLVASALIFASGWITVLAAVNVGVKLTPPLARLSVGLRPRPLQPCPMH